MDIPNFQLKDLKLIDILFFHSNGLEKGFGATMLTIIMLTLVISVLFNILVLQNEIKERNKRGIKKSSAILFSTLAIIVGIQLWTASETIEQAVASKSVQLMNFELYDTWYSEHTIPLLEEQEPEETYAIETLLKLNVLYGLEIDPRIEKVMEYYGVTEAYQVQYLSKVEDRVVKVIESPVFLLEGGNEITLSLYNLSEKKKLDTLPRYGLLNIQADKIADNLLAE